MRCWGGREKMYSPTSGLKTFQPRRMWRSREWDLYWIRTMMLRNPELMQLLRVKSMIRYLPPKGTAGLARSAVNGWRRSPRPPDRIMVKRFFIGSGDCSRTGGRRAKANMTTPDKSFHPQPL